jgi:hypothetical protein
MYILIRYPVGVVVEGVVLAHGRNRMRVAAAGFADAIELKRSGQDWIADRQPVEIEFMMSRARETSVVEAETPFQYARALGIGFAPAS